MQNEGDSGRTGPWIGALKEEGRVLSLESCAAARGEENPEPGLVAVPVVWSACHCLWGLSKQLGGTLGLCVQESVKEASICQPLTCM